MRPRGDLPGRDRDRRGAHRPHGHDDDPMSEEIIVRPDLDQVLSDEKNRALIEEFESESKTRTLVGWWDRIVTGLSVAVTLFALYYAAAGAEIPFTSFVLVPTFYVLGQTITTKQIYEMIFLAAVLVLTFL